MACKKLGKTRLVAEVVDPETLEYGSCAFCQRTVNDEVGFGKLYSIGNIYCHYFCVLLSCCLVQEGEDEEGLLGFLYPDILAEIERSKKHKCSYCGKDGATLGCAVTQCRKQFHLPCGREHNAVSLYYGTYKSFCEKHAPKQRVSDEVMRRARPRLQARRKNKGKDSTSGGGAVDEATPDSVCVICYEAVSGFPDAGTFWPPCCATDNWLHRSCLERMALSAGLHYLKCPLCNDKDVFCKALLTHGYYVPDRDAAWELEQNAFRDIYEREVVCTMEHCRCPRGRHYDSESGDIYEREVVCTMEHCRCPRGRHYDSESGEWDIVPCLLCGGGAHAACGGRVCDACRPAAPQQIQQLEEKIQELIQQEEAEKRRQLATRRRMPSRMSLRRTKPRATTLPEAAPSKPDTNSSRLDLNIRTVKKPQPRHTSIIDPSVLSSLENKLLSPIKRVEEGLKERFGDEVWKVDSRKIVEKLRVKFKKPRPLSEKRKIIISICNEIMNEVPKSRTPLKRFNSPKKHGGESPKQIDLKENTPQKSSFTENISGLPENENVVYKTPNKAKNPKRITDKNAELNDTVKAEVNEEAMDVDESSNSTFNLPAEFIAETHSDDSLPIFDTPKKSTTVNIEKDKSLEISENNEHINIDVIEIKQDDNAKDTKDIFQNLNLKSPAKQEKCAFKFSPTNKDVLEKKKVNIDLESFKNQYLNEVDKDYQCSYNHKHDDKDKGTMYSSAIKFAINAALKKEKDVDGNDKTVKSEVDNDDKPIIIDDGEEKHSESKKLRKRKLTLKRRDKKKKRKMALKEKKKTHKKVQNSVQIKVVYNEDSPQKESENTIDLTIESGPSEKEFDRSRYKKDIRVKIQWKSQQKQMKKDKKRLKRLKEKRKLKKAKDNVEDRNAQKNENSLKQTLLNFSPEASNKDVVLICDEKPTPKKRKPKLDKGADNMKQLSLHNFFKLK